MDALASREWDLPADIHKWPFKPSWEGSDWHSYPWHGVLPDNRSPLPFSGSLCLKRQLETKEGFDPASVATTEQRETIFLVVHCITAVLAWLPSPLEFLKQITNQFCFVKDKHVTKDVLSLPVCCRGVLDHLCLWQRDDIPKIAWQLYPRVAEPWNGECIKIVSIH